MQANPVHPGGHKAGVARGVSRRRGLTLVELVLAMAMSTIVVGAATAVMIVASRALPGQSDASVVATDGAQGLAVLEAELQQATRIRLSGTTLVFTIPDRTGDGAEETIQYAWSGVAGAALVRTEAGVSTDVVSSVASATMSSSRARGNNARVGTVYITLRFDRSLTLYSTVHLMNEAENNL